MTEICIFRLENFLSFWCMRRRQTPPTEVPHPYRVQRWGQPSCAYHHSIRSTIGFSHRQSTIHIDHRLFKSTIHIDNRLLKSTVHIVQIDCSHRQSTVGTDNLLIVIWYQFLSITAFHNYLTLCISESGVCHTQGMTVGSYF